MGFDPFPLSGAEGVRTFYFFKSSDILKYA